MKLISSRQNPLFKRFRNAILEHDDEIVIEGPKAVADAVAAGWKPIATITRGETFTAALFDQLSDTQAPQDVIALFERPHSTFADLRKSDSLIVALDGVQDPGNVGTIIRLAAGFDCAGVALLPGCADAFSPKTIRASAGAVLTVPIASVTAHDLLHSRLPIYAADADGENIAPPGSKAILVFGNEGIGVSDEISLRAIPIGIAMSPRLESLNVASSAAILLAKSYEARRGR